MKKHEPYEDDPHKVLGIGASCRDASKPQDSGAQPLMKSPCDLVNRGPAAFYLAATAVRRVSEDMPLRSKL